MGGLISFASFCLIAFGLNYLLLRRLDKKDRRIIIAIFIAALIVRVIFYFVFNHVILSGEFYFPDSKVYDAQGASFLDAGESQWAKFREYSHFTGMTYVVFGHYRIIPESINIMLGAWFCVLLFMISRDIFDKDTAMIAGIISVLYPSLVLWSTQLLKDMPVLFLSLLAIYVLNKYNKSPPAMLLIGVLIFMTCIMRKYSALFLGLIFLLSFFIINLKNIKKSVLPGLCLIVSIMLAFQFSGLNDRAYKYSYIYLNEEVNEENTNNMISYADQKDYENNSYKDIINTSKDDGTKKESKKSANLLDKINNVRKTLAKGRTSFENPPAKNYVHLLTFVPRGLLFFFFAPFPWEASRIDEYLFSIEMVGWYILFIFALYGMLDFIKERRTLPLWLYAIALALFYSVFSGNIGTIIRWRMQVFAILFIPAAIGIKKLIKISCDRGWLPCKKIKRRLRYAT